MTNNNLVPRADAAGNSLSVEINQDRLKHFFYMMHGEPTSRTKVFGGAIYVEKDDIIQLVDSLIEKLQLAKVRDQVIRVGVGFDKEITEKNYDEFKAYNWSEPGKTKELYIKINFLYEDFDSGNPLKHAFFLRIARELNPGNIFQIIASSDNDKIDNFESLLSPVFCRTDHINDELSKSLINAVSEWHKGQKQPQLISTSYKFAKEHKERLARLIHYIYPAVTCAIMCAAMFKANSLMAGKPNLLASLFSTLIVAIFSMNFFSAYGSRRASKIFDHLKRISEEDVVFKITKGDDKDYSERIDKNKKLFTSASKEAMWVFIQNVATGVIATVVYEFWK